MVDIRKIITMREMVLSELAVATPRPVVRAVGMAVTLNPFAGRFVDDLRPLFEARAMLGERLDVAASDAKQRRWLDRMRDCGRRLI
jgi:hypothetical protein